MAYLCRQESRRALFRVFDRHRKQVGGGASSKAAVSFSRSFFDTFVNAMRFQNGEKRERKKVLKILRPIDLLQRSKMFIFEKISLKILFFIVSTKTMALKQRSTTELTRDINQHDTHVDFVSFYFEGETKHFERQR